jgi:hypothetical protein
MDEFTEKIRGNKDSLCAQDYDVSVDLRAAFRSMNRITTGAEPYKRDLKTLHYHLLDAGHFALETNGDEIAGLMKEFLSKHVGKK